MRQNLGMIRLARVLKLTFKSLGVHTEPEILISITHILTSGMWCLFFYLEDPSYLDVVTWGRLDMWDDEFYFTELVVTKISKRK